MYAIDKSILSTLTALGIKGLHDITMMEVYMTTGHNNDGSVHDYMTQQ